MPSLMVLLIAAALPTGPQFNGVDFGSCVATAGASTDLRRVMFLNNRELHLDSSVGRIRISIQRQRFTLYRLDSPDGEHVVGDVGDKVGEGEERADVFVTLGFLDERPVLYWRETYQHRSFRQGLFRIEPDALNADWTQVLVPLCEERGGRRFPLTHSRLGFGSVEAVIAAGRWPPRSFRPRDAAGSCRSRTRFARAGGLA